MFTAETMRDTAKIQKANRSRRNQLVATNDVFMQRVSFKVRQRLSMRKQLRRLIGWRAPCTLHLKHGRVKFVDLKEQARYLSSIVRGPGKMQPF